MPHIPAAVRRRLPGIAWRDRKITHLETRVEHLGASRETARRLLQETRRSSREDLRQRDEQIARLTTELQEAIGRAEAAEAEHLRFRRSSFKGKLSSHVAAVNAAKLSGWHATTPALQLPYKLRSYALGQSHGIAVPDVHQVWERTEDIRIGDDLPMDRVVLKADGGHSGLGVVPLRRTESGWQTLTGRDSLEDGRPGERLLSRLERVRGPYFLESFLEAETEEHPSAPAGPVADTGADIRIPEDIKVYTAYGEIMQVLVMRTEGVRVMSRDRFGRRYFDADARPLGEVLPGVPEEARITPPRQWEQLMETARLLSIASGLPFVRVDLYATPQGPVLGELSPTPGGTQEYRLDHDLRLGAAWMRADLRLARDIARGRPPGTLFGAEPHTWWYRDPDASDRSDPEQPDRQQPDPEQQVGPPRDPQGPSQWPRVQADPLQWYTPPEDILRREAEPAASDVSPS